MRGKDIERLTTTNKTYCRIDICGRFNKPKWPSYIYLSQTIFHCKWNPLAQLHRLTPTVTDRRISMTCLFEDYKQPKDYRRRPMWSSKLSTVARPVAYRTTYSIFWHHHTSNRYVVESHLQNRLMQMLWPVSCTGVMRPITSHCLLCKGKTGFEETNNASTLSA